MHKFVILNQNPLRDRYYNSESHGDYICQPSCRARHTSLARASIYAKLETAVRVKRELEEDWDDLFDSEDDVTVDFRENHGVTKATRPDLVIKRLIMTAEDLSTEENEKVVLELLKEN